MNNSFNEENHVQCFNHTIQLSAVTLLKPFNTVLSRKAADKVEKMLRRSSYQRSKMKIKMKGRMMITKMTRMMVLMSCKLTESEQEQVLENMAVVHQTVTKVMSH